MTLRSRRGGPPGLNRRGLMGGGLALALAACRAPAEAETGPLEPFRHLAPFPIGVEITLAQARDPTCAALVETCFSRITPGLELKMEDILQDDGGLDFSRADEMLAFAESRRLAVHGHNLIWYIYKPPPFLKVQDRRPAFAAAFQTYVEDVAGRYRGRIGGWDVVNEPVDEEGRLNPCIWNDVLGPGYVDLAFHAARRADPEAVLILNDYNLERHPRKRAGFLRLAEGLLRRGVPLGGLGTQCHLSWTDSPQSLRTMISDVASLGLPVHVSELDVDTCGGGFGFPNDPARLRAAARLVETLAAAFGDLPARQRYGLTAWDLRDRDSWLRTPRGENDSRDAPDLFDDLGRPKPAAYALDRALRAARTG